MYTKSMKVSQKTYEHLFQKFQAEKETVINHYKYISENGNFSCLESRVGWDILRYVTPSNYITNVLYAEENLNDKHISSIVKRLVNQIMKHVEVTV